MTDCKPCSTPVDTQVKLSADLGAPVDDPTAYRSLAGALQYLTFTRPDLTYTVQQVCLHMHDPRESHLAMLKRLCNEHGTIYAISSDFCDRMITQLMGLMVLLSEHF